MEVFATSTGTGSAALSPMEAWVSKILSAQARHKLRWLWYSWTDSNRARIGLHLQFSSDERDLFFTSTSMKVGYGSKALFWEDPWINGRAVCELTP
jgi:hypothetical protein